MLNFTGPLDRSELKRLDNLPGIYVVYIYTFLIPDRIIYIGRSKDVSDRLLYRDDLDNWKDLLAENQRLLFFVASPHPKVNLERAEAAMIYKHQPKCNELGKDRFIYPPTRVGTSAEIKQLQDDFTVQ